MNSVHWHERVTSELRELPHRAWVACSRDSGIDYAIHRQHQVDYPEIVVSLDDQQGQVTLSQVLSKAISYGTGNQLLVENSTIEQGLNVLLNYQEIIGPIRVTILWAQEYRDFVQQVMEVLLPGSRLLVVEEAGVNKYPPPSFVNVSDSFLEVSLDEALCEAKGTFSDEVVSEIYLEASGSFVNFKRALLTALGLPANLATSVHQRDWSEGTNLKGVLGALAHAGLWVDLLELSCRNDPSLIVDYIDDVGHHLFNKGSFAYFWSRLYRLPSEVKRDERVAYWIVSVTNATKGRKQIVSQAKEVLGTYEVAEVIATTAVASPSAEMLPETRRAVQLRRSPATLRAYGFALAWSGDRNQPVPLFREALALAEQENASHLVIACATDVAEVELRMGNYKSASEWSQWALKEHNRRGLTEQLRFQSAAAINSFAQVLRGDARVASGAMSEIEIDTSFLDVPGFEAVVSARADLDFLSGKLSEAEYAYRLIHKNAPIEAYCITALGLLTCLLAGGKTAEAYKLAESASAVSRTSSKYEQALSDLMSGMTEFDIKPVVAEQKLTSAIEGLQSTISDLQIAQAALWLAMLHLSMGRRREAVATLRIGAVGLQDLGNSGWQLLSGNHILTSQLKDLWSSAEFEFEFQFLGGRTIVTPTCKKEIGIRSAEILAILSIHSDGLTGQRLHTYLYGESTYSKSAMKATISRLREVVPISSSPYRLDVSCKADFMGLLDLIANGEFQQALNSYTGPLMPESDSPLICEWRDHIDEVVRSTVLEQRDPDLLIQLATILDSDLEVWEKAKESVAANDYRRPVINARIRRIKATWNI